MSISIEDKEILWKEWSEIVSTKEDKIKLGQKIFQRLFTIHPEYIKLFKRFENMSSLDEIISSSAMKAHSLRFINSLNGVFETLDTPEELGDMLKHVGSSHKLRNVTCNHFVATVPILNEVLAENLKSCKVKEMVKNILNIAAPIILEGCSE